MEKLAKVGANVKVHISQNLVSIKNCYIHNANVFKGLAISKGASAFRIEPAFCFYRSLASCNMKTTGEFGQLYNRRLI